jgi:cysteinyl-tRNA synthetase
VGTAAGTAGHGGGADFTLSDRAHAPLAPLSAAGRALHDRVAAAVDDDLDLPSAIAIVRETLANNNLELDERRWLILDADFVFGLGLAGVWVAPADAEAPLAIRDLVMARSAARARGDYGTADDLRRDVAERGWEIVDGAEGPVVRPVSRPAP